MSCLDDNTVAALFEGKLSPEDVARVDAHVDQCAVCRRLVARVAAVFGSGAAATDPGGAALRRALSATFPWTGDGAILAEGDLVAGKFRIDALIGRGGMGAVYAATHEQLGHRVALKVMLPSFATVPEATARFLNEARAAANIQSEHVVRVTDVGTFEGLPFLAMELLEGADLAHLLQTRGPLPVEECVDLVLEALEGIAHAHALGIVHRDLKLANLFVATRADGSRCVKVLDFGISKVGGTLATPGEAPTRTGVVLGSPMYMAPEQIRDSKSVDARADVWAVGVILYKLLSGAHPFEGENIQELAMAIVAADAKPLRSLRPEVPGELEQVVARCLARAARERWPDVGALARALAPYGSPSARASARRVARVIRPDAEPMLSLPPPGPARRRVAALAIAAACVVAAAIAVGRLYCAGGALVASSAISAVQASAAAPAATTLADLPAYGTTNADAIREFREGLAERRGGRRRPAIEHLKKAIELDPAFPPAHVQLLAITFAEMGPAERAEYAAADALRDRMTPRDRAMLDAIEPLLLEMPADWRDSASRARRATEAFPRDAELFWLLALVSQEPSLADSAIAARRALELDPRYAGVYSMLPDVLAYTGQRADAHEVTARCLLLMPRSYTCLYVGATFAEEEGRCEDLQGLARRMLAVDQGEAMGRRCLVKALAGAGAIPAAREVLSQIPEQMEDFSIFNTPNAALLDFLAGDFAAAEALARKAAAEAQSSDEREERAAPAQLLVQIFLESGRLDDAAKVAADFLARNEAWQPDPDSDEYALMADPTPVLLATLRLAGRIAPAELESRRARWLTRWPRDVQSLAPYLWAHAFGTPVLVTGSADDAKSALAAMSSLPPLGDFYPAALPTAAVGVTFALGGRTQDALPWLRRATATCRAATAPFEQTRALYWLGRALEQTGDHAGACAAYAGVLARWGHAKPRSVTAEEAGARAAAARCEGR